MNNKRPVMTYVSEDARSILLEGEDTVSQKNRRAVIKPPPPNISRYRKQGPQNHISLAMSASSPNVYRNIVPNITPKRPGLLYSRRRPTSTPGLKTKPLKQKLLHHGKIHALGATEHYGRHSKRFKDQHAALEKSIDDRILMMSRVLPPEMVGTFYLNNFMKRKGPKAVNLIVEKLITGKQRQGFCMWKEKYLGTKQDEKESAMNVFNQQGGIRRMKRMLDNNDTERSLKAFSRWSKTTIVLRHIAQTPPSICIQRYFRGFSARHWLFKATAACILIQHIRRGVVGRRLYIAMRLQKQRMQAAIIIQQNWRIVLAQLAAARLRLSMAASNVGSLTGSLGNMSRPTTEHSNSGSQLDFLARETHILLQQAMNGELDMKTVKFRLAKLEIDVELAKQRASASALTIQCAYRQFVARARLFAKRLCHESAIIIQSAYRRHRAVAFVSVLKAVQHSLREADKHLAAIKVQNTYNAYKYRLTQQASLSAIIEAIRMSQQQIAAITIQDAFRSHQLDLLMEKMENQAQILVDHSTRTMQRIIRGHLGREYAKNHKLHIHAAQRLQRSLRCWLSKQLSRRMRISALKLGVWARDTLYQCRLRKLRRRVLHRWGRNRYHSLNRVLMGWPGWTEVSSRRAKLLKIEKANRLYRKTSLQKWWKGCIVFFSSVQHEKKMLLKAIRLWEILQYRRYYQAWYQNILAILDYKKKLKDAVQWWKNKEYSTVFRQLNRYRFWRRHRRKQKEIARIHLRRQRKVRVIMKINNAVEERKKQLMLAFAWFLSSHTRNSFKKLTHYVHYRKTHRAKIARGEEHYFEVFSHYAALHGLRKWVAWNIEEKSKRASLTKALAYWRKASLGKIFNQWEQFTVQNIAEKRRQIKACGHYKHYYGGRAIKNWHAWGEAKAKWRRKLFKMNKKALSMFRARKFSFPFYTWKEFWRQATVERRAIRESMSIEIQRVWRGHRGRKWGHQRRKIIALLRRHVVENEEDVEHGGADEFIRLTNENDWVLVMFFAEFATHDNPVYDVMKSAISGAAIDLKRISWPPVVTLKADALTKYSRLETRVGYATNTLGHAEKVPPDLPFIRLYWRGNRRMHRCPPLKFDFCVKENMKIIPMEKSRDFPNAETEVKQEGKLVSRSPMEKKLYAWVREQIKDTNERIYRPLAALDIQRSYRAKYAKYLTNIRRAIILRVKCAVKIQTAYRTHMNRDIARVVRKHIINIELNALKIMQRTWRGYVGRDFVGILLEKKRCKIENFPRAFVCSECKTEVGIFMCHECDAPYCEACFMRIHEGYGEASAHDATPIDYKAFNSKAWMCGMCEVKMARTFCEDCQDAYCAPCMKNHHAKGNRALHTRHLFLTRETSEFMRLESVVKSPEKRDALNSMRSSFIVEHRLAKCNLDNWKTPARIEWEQTEEGKRILAEEQAARRKKFLLDRYREEVQEIFDIFDLDESGTIDSNELYNMLVLEMCVPMKKKEIKQIAKELDTDGNGHIDFDEFLEWYVMEIIEQGKLNGVNLSRAQLKMRKKMNKMKEAIDTWKEEKFPYRRPKIKGGWDAFEIRNADDYPDDIKQVRPKFWWWVREEFGLAKEIGDVDEYREFTNDELDAFNTVFKPAWNDGRLKVRFYHDGRRFYHKKKFWTQHWDTEKEKFFWVEEETKRKTFINPQPTPGELLLRNAMSQKEKAKEKLDDLKVKAIENGKWLARRGMKYSKLAAEKAYHQYQQRGMEASEKQLYRMGFSREIALKSVEVVGNGDFEEAVQQAHYYQVMEDEKTAERKAFLKEHPPLYVHIGRRMKAAFIAVKRIIKPEDPLTEDEKRARAIEMMRQQMYGTSGGIGTDSEVETSDEEKYMMNFE